VTNKIIKTVYTRIVQNTIVTEQCTNSACKCCNCALYWLEGGSVKLCSVLQNQSPLYKTEGRCFHSLRFHGKFLLTYIFQSQYGNWVDTNCNRNGYQG